MKLSPYQLGCAIRIAREMVPVGAVLRHYKGGIYTTTGHVFDTETAKVHILYRRLDGPGYNAVIERDVVFSRPLDQFGEMTSEGVARFQIVL